MWRPLHPTTGRKPAAVASSGPRPHFVLMMVLSGSGTWRSSALPTVPKSSTAGMPRNACGRLRSQSFASRGGPWVHARQAEMASANCVTSFRQVRSALSRVPSLCPKSFVMPSSIFSIIVSRMDYATYRRAGFPIGSGTIESACKTVVQARMKLAGMRWSRAGATAMLTLRSLSLSDRWHELPAFS